MCLAHPHALPVLQVPPAQHAVPTAADQHCSARIPCECIRDPTQFAQGVQALATVDIPDEELSIALAPATTGELGAIGTPGHDLHHAAVSLQRSSKSAIRGIPQADAPLIAAA